MKKMRHTTAKFDNYNSLLFRAKRYSENIVLKKYIFFNSSFGKKAISFIATM